MLLFLSLCHTIVIDSRSGKYNAQSPDELALVNAAKEFGYVFRGKDREDCYLVENTHSGEQLKYKLLNVCEFSSARKRMSCIFRAPDGKIILMCKGADSVIEHRLSNKAKMGKVLQMTNQFVDDFALEGLRTLYLAEREISEEEYAKWNSEVQQAYLSLADRDERVAQVNELIEVDLELIGSSAIEDKLQDEVAETI